MTTKPYGARMLRALPPASTTDHLTEVARFYAR